MTSLTYQFYRVCWQTIPIVVLITFLIGAIIAQQGIFHFRKFGADYRHLFPAQVIALMGTGMMTVALGLRPSRLPTTRPVRCSGRRSQSR